MSTNINWIENGTSDKLITEADYCCTDTSEENTV